MSRSAVLIEETFVIPPCAFQCTSLIWGSDLRIPFGDVDRPELEDELGTTPSPSRISDRKYAWP